MKNKEIEDIYEYQYFVHFITIVISYYFFISSLLTDITF